MNEIDYSGLDLDKDWGQLGAMDLDVDEDAEDVPENNVSVPPEYVIKNSVAKHKQLGQILAVYFHAKHQEPMHDVFEHLADTHFITNPVESIHFHLDNE